MKFKLMEHQEYIRALMEANESLGVFADMGTGKTLIALSFIADHLKDGSAENALIIVPASLIGNWEDNIEKMPMFEGYDEEDVQRLKESVTLTSYSKLYRRNTGRRTVLRDEVDQEWDITVLDEGHALGGHSSRQTKCCLAIAKLSHRRYLMTGTPVSGSGKTGADWSKLYGEISFLFPGTWKNWTAFTKDCVTSYDPWFKPAGYRTEHCKKILEESGISIRLTDVVDMPERIEVEIPCELKEKKVYKDIRIGNLEPYGLDIDVSGGQYLKLLQICSGSMKRKDLDTLKLKTSKDDVLKTMLESTDEKIVVFCAFHASIDRVKEIGRKLKRKCVTFDGRVDAEQKKKAKHDFQEGDADLFIVQYQAGGMGLDLYASHIMIMFEPCFSVLNLDQARGRTFRTGQQHECRNYYLYTPKTIEEKVLHTVRSGQDVTSSMLEKWAHGEEF